MPHAAQVLRRFAEIAEELEGGDAAEEYRRQARLEDGRILCG
ncbi:hypothetical protein [Streptomyces sp. NPDC005009]